MSESIFEHTTSIAGLTCKPLAILSEIISPQEMSRVRGGNGGRIKMPGDGNIEDGITSMDEPDCPTYDCYPEGGPFDTVGQPFTQEFDYVFDNDFGSILGGSGGGGSSESDTTNDDEGHLEDFWDFDFSDDDTEDECTVPYDCGYEDNDDDNNG